MLRRRSDAAGVGVAYLLVVTLFGLGVILVFSHTFWSGFVSDITQKSVEGDEALDLALNALAEAHLRLTAKANDPAGGGALFQSFREQTGPFTVELPLADLPVFRQDLERTRGYSTVDPFVSVEVLFQAPFAKDQPLPYDRFGTVRLSVGIRTGETRAVRRLHQTFDFKLHLTAPPRFFDTYTFFAADPTFLVNSYAINNDANETIQAAEKRLKELFDKNEELIRLGGQCIQQAEQGRASANPLEAPVYDAAIENMRKVLQVLDDTKARFPKVTIKDAGEDTLGTADAMHRFPKGPFAVYSYEPKFDLAVLNLPDRVKARNERLGTVEMTLKLAMDKTHQFLQGKPQDLGPLPAMMEAYREAALAAAAEYRDLLLIDYKGFQDALIEVGEEAFTPFLPLVGQLDRDLYESKASLLVSQGDPGGTHDSRPITEKVNELLDRLEGLSGLVYVRNPDQELTLDRTFKGRLVLAVEGNVTIRRAVAEDPSQDLLTVICFGKMDVTGPVRASLVPVATFRTAAGVTITGNLATIRPNFIMGQPTEVLGATIVRDPIVAAGPPSPPGAPAPLWPDYQYLTLAPEPLFVDIERR